MLTKPNTNRTGRLPHVLRVTIEEDLVKPGIACLLQGVRNWPQGSAPKGLKQLGEDGGTQLKSKNLLIRYVPNRTNGTDRRRRRCLVAPGSIPTWGGTRTVQATFVLVSAGLTFSRTALATTSARSTGTAFPS